MIDLHTHSFLSDGALIPSELVRRAVVAGYSAIAITDHVDHSNLDIVVPALVRAARALNTHWKIKVIPGAEITHVPIECFGELTARAREKGAGIVVAHGESPAEPVLAGTNRGAILAGVDILAHPGNITCEDAELAAEKGVHLEITARAGHDSANRHVFDMALKAGAKLVLNTDGHLPGDLLSPDKIEAILGALTDSDEIKQGILNNSRILAESI